MMQSLTVGRWQKAESDEKQVLTWWNNAGDN